MVEANARSNPTLSLSVANTILSPRLICTTPCSCAGSESLAGLPGRRVIAACVSRVGPKVQTEPAAKNEKPAKGLVSMPEQYRELWLGYFLTMLLESGLKSVGMARLAIASSSSGQVVGGDYG